MKLIILGAGAIGCYVGGRLAAAGQPVTLVGRPRIIDPLARDGLGVSDLEGFKTHVSPTQLRLAPTLAAALAANPLSPEQATVILLCVKGGATTAAALEIAASCPDGTAIISLQNGVENPSRIASAAPQLLALAGMVPYNVVMPHTEGRPPQVHRATAGSLYLARHPVTEALAPLLAAAGLPTVLNDDMRAVQWGKLLLNLNNPVNALSNLPLRQQLLNHDYRRVLATLQTEALAALTRAGIEPATVAAVPPRLLPHLLRLPNWLFTRVAARMLNIDASARSSMWDDLQQGRTTEIDDFCGAVHRLSTRHGLSAPANAAMCQLMATYPPVQPWTGPALLKALTTATLRQPG